MIITIDLMDWRLWVWVQFALFVLLLLTAPLSLWRDFAAVMNVRRVMKSGITLSPYARILAVYLLVRGYFLDLFVNVFHMSIVMWEWPREMTVTARLQRHWLEGTERTKAVAAWFAGRKGLHLDDLDPSGKHV